MAQALLPHIEVHPKGSTRIIQWSNGYTSIERIGIQRSMDSLYNYATIGYATNPDKAVNAYIDKHPDGYVFYRLFIFMSNGQYFFSDPARATEGLFVPAPPTPFSGPSTTAQPSGKPVWKPSPHVFTNQNGNVSILLDTTQGARYRLRILDADGKALFDLDGIRRPNLILDKSNFMRSGWYHFELFDNGKLSETSKFFIPDSVSSAHEDRR